MRISGRNEQRDAHHQGDMGKPWVFPQQFFEKA
jgi:hypothetical protein